MHDVAIGQDILDRVMARRGRVHLFDSLDPGETALVVIDMQNFFCAPGAPAEVAAAREVVPAINRLATETRQLGGLVIWVTWVMNGSETTSDWQAFLDHFLGDPEKIAVAKEMLKPGGHGTKVWQDLQVEPGDVYVPKNRYSAFINGASGLERLLRSAGIRNLLLAGTKTNVCVESTGRDAMMLDFNVVVVADCCATSLDREHLATLETFIQQFGDVMTKDEVVATLRRKQN